VVDVERADAPPLEPLAAEPVEEALRGELRLELQVAALQLELSGGVEAAAYRMERELFLRAPEAQHVGEDVAVQREATSQLFGHWMVVKERHRTRADSLAVLGCSVDRQLHEVRRATDGQVMQGSKQGVGLSLA